MPGIESSAMQSFTVHYMNLAYRTDRNNSFLKLNQGLARFERVNAVVGKDQCIDDLIRDGLVQEPLEAYSPGALGNALSHKQMWDLASISEAGVTVAEDDAIFNRHFARKAAVMLNRLSSDWD